VSAEPLADRDQAVLDALVRHARPIIREYFSADSCIASTRIGLDVLEFFGLHGQPMPVMLAVWNADALALIERVGIDQAGPQILAQPLDQTGGPWTVGIGARPEGNDTRPGGWNGHLVIGLPRHDVLVDLSVDQASRPLKNIHLQPLWTQPGADWWHGGPEVQAVTGLDYGTALTYRHLTAGGDGYRASPNWKRRAGTNGPALFRTLTGRIIRQIKNDLDG
jgi:hypothetical protein